MTAQRGYSFDGGRAFVNLAQYRGKMLKKAIKTFNRGLMIGFEIVGVLALLVFLGWCGLVWRLSQGPIDLAFVTERMERAMHERNPDFKFGVGKTLLTWGGHFQPFEIELRDVDIVRADDTPLLSVKKLGVQLSKRHLFVGKLMPKVIRVYHPSFRIMRWEDGHFSFNLNEAPLPVMGPPLPAEMAAQATEARREFIRNLLTQLRDRTGFAALLGGLHEISIRHAEVVYEDKILNTSWQSADTTLRILRQRGGIDARADMAVDLSADKRAVWSASVKHNWATETTGVVVSFSDLDLAEMSAKSEAFKPAAGLDIDLYGAVKFVLDRDFKPGTFEFVVGGENGTFSGFDLYEAAAPLPVASLYVDGATDPQKGSFILEQLKIKTGEGPTLDATIGVTRDAVQKYTAAITGTLYDTPMDDLHRFWPKALAPDPRLWVTTHLSAGTARRATIDALVHYAQEDDAKKITVEKLGGEIFFDGIKVDYFPPLKPVLGAKGRAYYDAKSFNLDISGGKLGDMTATKSTIHITNLDHAASADSHAQIDIAVSLTGPLNTALSVLDAEPLGYPKMLGLDSATVKGTADVDVSFKFPIHKKLDIKDVAVKASARAKDVSLQSIVAGLPLTGGPMDLTVSNGSLNIKGDALLSGTPVTFDWTKNFTRSAAYDQRATAKLVLDEKLLKHFGVPDVLAVKGRMASEVVYQLGFDQAAKVSLKGNVGGLGLTIPFVDFVKQPNAEGSVALALNLKNNNLQSIRDLSLETTGMLLQGELDFARDAKGETALETARLSRLMYGETDIAVTAQAGDAAGYMVKINGQQLDARPFTGDDDVAPAPNTDAKAAETVTPLHVNMDVKRLVLGKDRALDDVKMVLKRNQWQRIEQMEMDAAAGGKAVYLRYMPAANGSHSLRFEADNAGAALAVFGITKSIRGGTLVVRGEPTAKGGPRDLNGTAQLNNFTLKDTPVMAKLLNAMSLVGILDLLNGEGLSFSKARVNFHWVDRGQPQQAENTRMIRLKDGRTSGTSLGLTFEGNIDYWARKLDLDGTIIPVSEVSSLISGIPLVGDILTAGGEGLLAATYTVTGAMAQPIVSVNPLAVLAPGILRKVFFE